MRAGIRYSSAKTMWAKQVLVCAAILLALPAMARKPAMAANSKSVVVLHGNVPSFVSSQADYGFAAPSMAMNRIILALKIAPAKKAELDELLKEQQDPSSSHYHCWLTPEQFGKRFGPTKKELRTVERWLKSQGFRIDSVAKGRLWINFSGNVAQVEQAFHTRIHNYMVNGKMYDANATNPAIPANLAPIVAGVVSLNNYPLKPMNRGFHKLSPTDAAAVAAKAGGIQAEWAGTANGTSGVYTSPIDWATIYDANPVYSSIGTGTGVVIGIVGRTNPGTTNWATFRSTLGLPVNTPTIIINGTNPGDLGAGEDGEADLDAEWSGGVAPGATVKFVASKTTTSTDGVDLSAEYIVDNNLADVMSTSFGQCEASMGSTENTFYNNLWSQAATEGITSCVSTGDSGPAGCASGSASSGTGESGVNGLATTSYNIAVGATELSTSSSYWDGSGAAISYIPETPWNESGTVSGGSGLWSTSSGASSVYNKPSWQVAPGVPASDYRYLPDVCLDGSDMFFGNYGMLVYTQGSMETTGGTSAASPSFAGVMALIVQRYGRQGNANVRLYELGNAQYGSGGPTVFHDITSGDNNVPGLTGFTADTAWDEVTGLGTPDVAALVSSWNPCTPPGTPTGLTATVPGDNEIDVSWTPGTPSGNTYNLYRATGTCPSSGYSLLASGLTSFRYKDTSVSGGTTYSYEVTAVDSTGGCESAVSGCASAAATGACTAPPTFGGLVSVTNPGNATCELELAWSAATANCGTSVTYNVYRSTVASFTPSASNMIATGVTATAYSDTNALSNGSTYYYVVRAVDASTGVEDANTSALSGVPLGPSSTSTPVNETFEEAGGEPTSGGTWSHSAAQGTDDWAQSTGGNPHSGSHTFFSSDASSLKDDYLVTPAILLGNVSAQLSFWHTYYLESGYDGAVIEISTDRGSTWTDLGSQITKGGYTGTISTSYSSPIAGRQAWTGGAIGAETQVIVDLSPYLGQTVQIRFRQADDVSVNKTGWYIDDVVLTTTGGASCATVGAVKPVPDGNWVSGTAIQATKAAADGSTVNLTWDVGTCRDANYNLYYGNGTDISTYTLQGSDCGLGNSGTASGVTLPAVPSGQHFIWWVIAGTDGVQTESSWGRDSAGNERHPAASGQCGFTAKSPASTCP